jgi:hypothetical protein
MFIFEFLFTPLMDEGPYFESLKANLQARLNTEDVIIFFLVSFFMGLFITWWQVRKKNR